MTKKPDAYEKYIKNLEQLGTYGDNGCLVAFARLYQVKINIHQLNMPIWEISGVTRINDLPRELHLSYHNGEHYSSVRTIGDRTRAPANISITKNGQNNFDSYTSKNGNTQTKKNQKNLTENPDNYGYAYAFPIEDDDLSNTFSEYNFNKKVERDFCISFQSFA